MRNSQAAAGGHFKAEAISLFLMSSAARHLKVEVQGKKVAIEEVLMRHLQR